MTAFAGGAPLFDVLTASAVGVLALVVTVLVTLIHRKRRLRLLEAVGRLAEGASGLPAWASLPLATAGFSLVVAVFGFYWDVSWHIDRGRDPGPFANPAHWFIIVGLAGIALAGTIAIALGPERSTPTSLRLRDDWHAPVGGVLLLLCGSIALATFPLDDIWHRLFGQDVTLWSPTHLLMVGGASLSTLALWLLATEGRRAAEVVRTPGATSRVMRWVMTNRTWILGGAVLMGLSTLQAEFDYGVPQFRLVFQPILIMLASSIALVAVRAAAGRGAAIKAAFVFLGLRGALALLISFGLGRTLLHLPLYLAAAALVELVAARVSTSRTLAFGVWSGLAIGTAGLAAEWGWSHLFSSIAWPASLASVAIPFGFAAAMAGALLGAQAGSALAGSKAAGGRTRLIAGFAWLTVLVVMVVPLSRPGPTGLRAEVTLHQTRPAPDRWVTATVRLSDPHAADGANWFDVTSWQGAGSGDGGLVIDRLRPAGPPGEFVSTTSFPVYGNWKSLLRLHVGSELAALPIYLPADPGIPAPEVAAFPSFTRTFQPDHQLLMREAVGGSPLISRSAYIAFAVVMTMWIAALAWGFSRMGRAPEDVPDTAAAETRRPVSAVA